MNLATLIWFSFVFVHFFVYLQKRDDEYRKGMVRRLNIIQQCYCIWLM